MTFSLVKTIDILERTPSVLENLLSDLHDDWTMQNEGGESWSPYAIMGHLVHGETADWMPRLYIILSDREDRVFEPFDRFAQFEDSQGKSLSDLIEEFKFLRQQNLKDLKALNLTQLDLQRQGQHPELGTVILQELLATWSVHDLGHIAQITRVMAKQYEDEVGVWREYLGILKW